ncbi:lysosomal amino acid transporter 1 homolog isoform X1 [Oxyura jamaicensis]|uniref:lysosomal amino acid transporter 1 homolog isoform X1 n=1 Tax=Oxyura jamaicensis TaxID=8884 RepID=UPI0015A70464|nr:lysosomal amino acid transporter 1 homolog isoform X1 [Oxyura jamaicensis]
MASWPGNDSECPNGSRWVLEVFNECAQDGRDIASVVLGLVSICCFAAASFPQFYQACKTGIMDQALSIYFLLGWLGGDLLNLIGSFLANQLPLQVYTAVYYVLADLVMLSLYCYYKAKNRGRGFVAPINVACLFCLLGAASAVPLLGRAPGLASDAAAFRGRSLLSAGPEEPESKVSRFLGPGRQEGEPLRARGLAQSLPCLAALHQERDRRLRHRLCLLRAVPLLPSPPDLHQLPEEIHRWRLLLPLRPGDAGELAVRRQRAAEEPRAGAKRRGLRPAPPALAHRQPGRPLPGRGHLFPVPCLSRRAARYW